MSESISITVNPVAVIFIVIPVYNRKEFTKECLQALQRQTYQNYKAIVVDDGSTDGTAEMMEKEFPEAILLKGDGNLFWTAAVNMGIREALKYKPDFVMTLNNDTIPAEDFLEKMMYWAEKKPDVLLGALELEAGTTKPVYGGEITNWKLCSSVYLLDSVDPENRTGLHLSTFFPGRGLLIPVKVFDSVGLFEEKQLPHYLADYDFTLLASRAGFPVYCNFDARLYTYPDECGDTIIRKSKKSLRNYWNHLFSIKGGGNLRNFTVFTFRNCPKKDLPISLVVGYARRLFGYWIAS